MSKPVASKSPNSIPEQHIPGGEKKTLPKKPDDSSGCATSTEETQHADQHEGDSPGTKSSNEVKTDQPSQKNEPVPSNGSTAATHKKSHSTSSDDDTKYYQTGTKGKTKGNEFPDTDDEDKYSWSSRDIEEYRNNYPHKRETKSETNYKFYTNKIRSHPDNVLIDEFHTNWLRKYRELEYHHGYIQWLFPIQEAGLNWSAEPLGKTEIIKMKSSPEVMQRLLKSYELMLDFYGFQLIDENTGQITRTGKCEGRFDNLNHSSHNYLRITRILKCLGEFDFEHLKFGFLVGILPEIIIEKKLKNCLRSCRDYWIKTLFDANDRSLVRQYANALMHCKKDGGAKPEPPKRSENACIGRSMVSSKRKNTS